MKRKTEIVRVKVGNRVESFANAEAAERYRVKWGGEILAGNIAPAPIGKELAGIGTFSGPPMFSPGTAALLALLPCDCSQKEYETAWKANQNQCAVLHVEAIREALVRRLMRDLNFSRKAAEEGIRMRFRKLFTSELGKSSGVNSRSVTTRTSTSRTFPHRFAK